MDDPRVVEELAALAHEQWGDWVGDLIHFHLAPMAVGKTRTELTLSSQYVDCWLKLRKTPYADLGEGVKEINRDRARKTLQVLYAHGRAPAPFYLPRSLHYLAIRLFGARHLPCPLCGELHRYGVRLPNGERVDVLWTQGTKGLVVSRDSEYFGHRYPLVVKERTRGGDGA